MLRKLMAAALLVAIVALPTGSADATFHGDNGRIAFRRFFNSDQTWAAIFTVNPDGTRERQVTFPPDGFVDRNPDVSPDGKRILFQRDHVVCAEAESGCPSEEVWVVGADGSRPTRLTRQPHAGATCDSDGYCDHTPAWSPGGKRIVFSRFTGPYDPAEDLLERVALFTMRTDGSHVRQLTQKVLPATGEDSEPQWSPDGRSILFQRWNVRTAEPVDTVALWVLDLRSGRQRQITPSSTMAGDTPDWSPNGKLVLFHDWQGGPPPGVSANLWTVRPDGSHLRQLTFADDGVTMYLGSSFSPDGTRIVFGRRPATGGPEANAADVFTMHVDGTHERPVTRTVQYDSYPDWGPTRR